MRDIPDCPGGIATDLAHWPIVIMTAPARALSDLEFKAYLAWVEKYVTCHGETYAIVNDVRYAPAPSAAQRRLVAEQMERLKLVTKRHCAGNAMVFQSQLMRGIMTAIFWMAQPDYPTKVFATVDQAIAWCEVQLGREQHRRAVEARLRR